MSKDCLTYDFDCELLMVICDFDISDRETLARNAAKKSSLLLIEARPGIRLIIRITIVSEFMIDVTATLEEMLTFLSIKCQE